MAIIWIIEKKCALQGPLAANLLGDFAVRVFASMESVLRIAKMRGGPKPELLLVNMMPKEVEAKHLQCLAGLAPVVCFMGPSWVNERQGKFHHIASWADDFDLTFQLKALIRSNYKGDVSHRLSYKDLELDTERFELSIPLAESKESLPKKEAMILKLLLQRPGECLTRQEIKRKVWSDLVVTERTIDCHVSRLRKRLVSSEISIQSVYGGGYILS